MCVYIHVYGCLLKGNLEIRRKFGHMLHISSQIYISSSDPRSREGWGLMGERLGSGQA